MTSLGKAIIVENVSKKYKLYTTSKERLFDLLTPKSYGNDFYALKNINFTAQKGEVIGFIGINGSGKSTLSNIIAGIVPPTTGEVTVNGETSLIAVSAGLKADLTGRDNIEMKLLMLGFNKKEILDLEPGIIEFSELGDFIDQPVKSYSSGMKSRLGFSISVNVDPEILIIDEALSVGDKAFAEKSLAKMNEFKDEGKTMIFVSHSIGQMKRFCTKILWLEFGQVKEYGEMKKVIPQYEDFLAKWEKMTKEERASYKRAALKASGNISNVDIDNYFTPNPNYNKVIEKPISKLAHFRGTDSYLLKTPDGKEETSTKRYKDAVYYVKKEARYQEETYYLLSTKRSSVEGIIGWIQTKYLAIHDHIFVDTDIKEVKLTGEGEAYSAPWGGRKQLLLENLAEYNNHVVEITCTEYVGRNLWYQVEIKGQSVWLNHKFVKEVNNESA